MKSSHQTRARRIRLSAALLSLTATLVMASASAGQAHPAMVVAAPATPLATATVMQPLAASKPLHIVVGLKLRNEAELQRLIGHKPSLGGVTAPVPVMTPKRFLAEYSPTQAQAEAVASYLRKQGFGHIVIAPNRMLVSAEGTAAKAQAAFRTSMAQVQRADGSMAYANTTSVSVPTALQSTILSVIGLQNVHRPHTYARLAADTAATTPHYPTEFDEIYDAGNLPTAAGVPVGIMSQGKLDQTLSDLAVFTDEHDLPPVTTEIINTHGSSSDARNAMEWNLDSQTIVGMAGGAVGKLVFYNMPTLSNSELTLGFNRVVTDNNVKIINVSLGECELYAQADGSAALNDQIFEQAVAQGQTFAVSTGDSGADECHDGGITPSTPASSPWVVAVGGTNLQASTSEYYSETVWRLAGGSPSTFEPMPYWQQGIVPGNKRGLPDIAFDADPHTGAIIVFVGGHSLIGGTSLSAPIFAGAWARLLAMNGGLQFAAPYLYQTLTPVDFHDVRYGNNGGEVASEGYDFASGFGSVRMDQVAQHIMQPGPPSLGLVFEPNRVDAGNPSTLTLSLNNWSQPDDAAVLTADLVDVLPAGIVLAANPKARTTCGGGALSAMAGSNSFSLGSGASIPAAGSCAVKLEVTSATDGVYHDTIASGALQTTLGANIHPITARLQIGYIFPEPYCEADFSNGVLPITQVKFDGIDNTTSAVVNGTPASENFINLIAQVYPGQRLRMAVEGNTDGDYTAVVDAFIDWNHNGSFADADERYVIGNLVDSTGTDGKQAVATIAVPADALPGNTRIRVMKHYGHAAEACNRGGYGQAEDYVVNVAAFAPTATLGFSPTAVATDAPSTLTITLGNQQNAAAAILSADFVDLLPANLVIADSANLDSTCVGGSVMATPGGGSITLTTGAAIPANGACTLSADVQSATKADYVDTIAAGDLATSQGTSQFDSSASLTVGLVFPQPWCSIDYSGSVEPVTHVLFAGIDQHSDAAIDGSPALENFTAVSGNVQAGTSVPMTVAANTGGNFHSYVSAYVDWNHNGSFSDAGERTVIGQMPFSDGTDGKQVSAMIEVPLRAAQGPTRMRVTNHIAQQSSACGDGIYGQAEDYTLAVGAPDPRVAISFDPASAQVNTAVDATISLINASTTPATLTAALSDPLPAALVVQGAPATTCTGGPGAGLSGNVVSLGAGAKIPPQSQCEVTFELRVAQTGSYVDTIAAGALQTDAGDNPLAASATLQVRAPDPVATVAPGVLDFSLPAGSQVAQTLTIANIATATGAIDLHYHLDEGAHTNARPGSFEIARAKRKTAPPPGASLPSLLRAPTTSLGAAPGGVVVLDDSMIAQMNDNTPGRSGIACADRGAHTTSDNSWWRRFYFDEYAGMQASEWVANVTIASGPTAYPTDLPVTVNLYTIPHGVPMDTIPTDALTLIGTGMGHFSEPLTAVTIPVHGKVSDTRQQDLVVEYHIDGYSELTYPGANDTPQTHPTFMSSVACEIEQPTRMTDIDSSFYAFHLIMVVQVSPTEPPPVCFDAQDIPWLSETPTSGIIAAGGRANVAVSADASALSDGLYHANVCVGTNDPTQRLINVPVSLTVTPVEPPDRIFADGFEGDAGAAAVPAARAIVRSGPLNWLIPDSEGGLAIDLETGLHGPFAGGSRGDVNLYDGGNGSIYAYFYGDVVDGNVGALVDPAHAVAWLPSGTLVGPNARIDSRSQAMRPSPTSDGYIGIAFRNEASGRLNYGYLHLRINAAGEPSTLLDYAYKRSGGSITIP